MKKKTLLNALIIILLIIMGVSFVIAGFRMGTVQGLVTITFMSLAYLVIIAIVMTND